MFDFEFNCPHCLLIVPDAAVSRAIHARICAQVVAQRAKAIVQSPFVQRALAGTLPAKELSNEEVL